MSKYKDRPSTMSVKEYLIRKISQEQNIPYATVNIVIKDQFRNALNALQSNNSVEISGFGTFILGEGRVDQKIRVTKEFIKKSTKKLESNTLSEKEHDELKARVESRKKVLIYLNKRKDGFKS